MPTKVPLMIKRKTPPIVKVSIDGRCAKLNKTDGTSTAMYLFHLLSSSLIMKFADLRDIHTAAEFIAYIDRVIETHFTDDYFRLTLPNELNSAAAISPAWYFPGFARPNYPTRKAPPSGAGLGPAPCVRITWHHQPVIRVRISLEKVITIPPARVRKPLDRWEGSWLWRERPT